jgi:heat shock protein HtpX
MFRRIFLFIAVNILVMLTITTLLRMLNVQPYLTAYGLNYGSLAIFCLIWGMAGSIISLLLSKIMAKFMMGVQIIDPRSAHGNEAELVQTVHRLARAAGLGTMPEVGIYESPEVNAFATGPSRSNSLVAVSTGLLNRMDRSQVEGVLGHEVAHIANGDMVTMTLLQGIINAFVMFFSRVIAFAVSQALSSGRDREERGGSPGIQFAVTFILEIVFSILGMMVVAWFSRLREFRADAGGARFAGRENMIGALRALQGTTALVDTQHQALETLKISGKASKFFALFSTHPPLEERIMRLSMGR